MSIGRFGKDVTKEGCIMCIKLELDPTDTTIVQALLDGYDLDIVLQSAAVEVASNALSISKSTRLNPVPQSTPVQVDLSGDPDNLTSVYSIWVARINMSLGDVRAVSSNGFAQGFDTAAAQDKLQVSASIDGTAISLEWLGGMQLRNDGSHAFFEEPFLRRKAAGSTGGLTDRIFKSLAYKTYEGLLTFTRSLTLSQGSRAQISRDTQVTVDIKATYRDIKVDDSLTLRGVSAVKIVAGAVPLRIRQNRENTRDDPVKLQSSYSLDSDTFCVVEGSTSTELSFGQNVTTTTAADQVLVTGLNNGEPTELSAQVLLRLSGQSVTESDGGYSLSETYNYFDVWSEVGSSMFVTAAVQPNPPTMATSTMFGLYGASTPTDGTTLLLGVNAAAGYGSNGAQTLVDELSAETQTVSVTGVGDIQYTTAKRKRPSGKIDFAVLIRDDELLNGHKADDPLTRQVLEVKIVDKTAVGWPKEDDGTDKPADFIRPLTHKEALDAVAAHDKIVVNSNEYILDGALIKGDYAVDNVSLSLEADSADQVLIAYLDENEPGWRDKSRLQLTEADFRNTDFTMDNFEIKLACRTRVTAVAAEGHSSQTSAVRVSDTIFFMDEPKPYTWAQNKPAGMEEAGTVVDIDGTQRSKMRFIDIEKQTGPGSEWKMAYLKDQLAEAATHGDSSAVQAQDIENITVGGEASRVLIHSMLCDPHKRRSGDTDDSGQIRKAYSTFRDVATELVAEQTYSTVHSTPAFTRHTNSDSTVSRGVSNNERFTFEQLCMASEEVEGDFDRPNDFELAKRLLLHTDSRVLKTQVLAQDLNQCVDHRDAELPTNRDPQVFATRAVVCLLTLDSVNDIDQLTGTSGQYTFGGTLTQSASNTQLRVQMPTAIARSLATNNHTASKYDTRLAGYRRDRANIALREVHTRMNSSNERVEHTKEVQAYEVSFESETGEVTQLKDGSDNPIPWAVSTAQSGLLRCQDLFVGATGSGPLGPTAARDTKNSNLTAVGTHNGNVDILLTEYYKKDYTDTQYLHYAKHAVGTGISEHQGTTKTSNRERYWTYPVLEGAALIEIIDLAGTHQLIALDINTRNAVTATEANTANDAALSWNAYAAIANTPVDQFTTLSAKEQDVMLIAVKKETVVNPDVATSIIDNALVVQGEALVVNSYSNWGTEPTPTLTGRGIPGDRSSSQVVTFSLAASEEFVADQFVGNDTYVFVNMENSKSIFCRFDNILGSSNKITLDYATENLSAEERHDKAVLALLDPLNQSLRQVPANQLQLETNNNAATRDSVVS